jgi:predicted membrane-bound dolichyl-phosphate-mannose-protein mannosyltransferase
MQEPSLLHALFSLMPFLLFTLISFFFAIPISRRKGKGVGFAAWCLVPFVTLFILFYLVSLTDKSVLDRLAALESRTS